MKTLTLAAPKGGTGKASAAVHLAAVKGRIPAVVPGIAHHTVRRSCLWIGFAGA